MIGVVHTFAQLPPRFRATGTSLDAGLQAGLQRIGDLVERGMNRNLSGGGKPGSYPVPRRTGNLARSGGNAVSARSVVIFNSAEYAVAVHEGFRAFGNPHAPQYPGRPFLDDAALAVDPAAEIQTAWERLQ